MSTAVATAAPNRLWTKKDVADFFGCSEKSVDRMEERGEIKRVRWSLRSVRFDPREIVGSK